MKVFYINRQNLLTQLTKLLQNITCFLIIHYKMQPPVLTKSSSQLNTWTPYKSWKYPRDLVKSIPQMSQQQLYLNLVQINLCAYYNPDVLQMVNNKMTDTAFYLKNRHMLQNLVNTYSRQKGLNEKIKQICKKFDQIYVNGNGVYSQADKQHAKQQIANESTVSQTTIASESLSITKKSIKTTRTKHHRAKFIARRQDFILALAQISDKLFACQQGKTPQQINLNKQKLFAQQIIQLNRKIQEQQEIKSTSSIDSSSQLQQPLHKVNFSTSRGYTIYYKNNFHQVTSINVQNSAFIPTKNRNPLKLDFEFAKFIYKNDDQLAHQIIAMQFIKHLNKIFGKQYIKEYEIIPQIKGALYQFVQGAMTVAQIKKEHKDLSEYLKYLSETKGIDLKLLQRKFVQSYAGYCLAEFMLDIKDRNNANLMMKQDGTFFHIDLAFIFNAKPGGISFESAPFKMTKQYVKAMGGFESDNFKYFQSILIQLITKIYQSKDQFLYKIDILGSRSKQIRCFNGFDSQKYRELKIVKSLDRARQFVQNLIDKSFDSWCTKKYDTYQWKTNKIPA